MADDSAVLAGASHPRRPSRFFGQYLIKTRFQFKFALMIFGFLAAAALLIWMEGHFAVKNWIETGVVVSEDGIAQLKLLNSIMGKTIVLALAITFLLSLFFSHFVAGPIYRFEKTLEEMREGNLTIFVRLRKHDELKEVGDIFNQTIVSLRNRIKKERESVALGLEKAEVLVAKLRQEGRTAEADELAQVIAEIRSAPPQLRV